MQPTYQLLNTYSLCIDGNTLNLNHEQLLSTNCTSSTLTKSKITFRHDFLENINEYAERVFGDQAQQMIDSFLYPKMQPHLKKSLNLAFLGKGTYDQIRVHLEKEQQLSGRENDGDFSIPTKTVPVTKDNINELDFSKTSCFYCKNLGHLIKDCRKRIRIEQEQKQDTDHKIKGYTQKTYSLCPHCRRINHPPEKCWNGPNAVNRKQKLS